MKAHIVGMSLSKDSDLSVYPRDPSFRKATAGMIMGYAALEPLLRTLDRKVNLEKVAFVLGSSSGELSVTNEFLKTLDTQGIARPLLFQNSLHNATLGFLALKIGLTGPTVSVSNRHFTAENCLETASILLDSGSEFCVVMTVESRVQELGRAQALNYPAGAELGEGAGALLLTREENLKALGLESLAVLDSVDCYPQPDMSRPWLPGSYYDSNGIEELVTRLRAGQCSGEIQLVKPDNTYSILKISAGATL